MRGALACLLCGLSACTLLLDASEHQGGPPAMPDGSADGSSDGGDAGSDGSVGGPCDMDEDGHRAKGDCGGDDCDDTKKHVYPGAMPICGDGVVNDCEFGDDAALAGRITGSQDEEGELGIMAPVQLAQVVSPTGVRTLAIAMAPLGDGGGGVWVAHLVGQPARERIPALLYANGDAPLTFASISFPAPAVSFHDVAAVALGSGESEAGAEFALFASKPFDADDDGVADASGWAGTLGPAVTDNAIEVISPVNAQAKFAPRAVIAGGGVKYPEHYTALFETRTSTSHFMTAFRGNDASSYREVNTDAQSIVAAGGSVEAVGTRGPHVLLHEPGSAQAYLWGYAGNTALIPFNLTDVLDNEVTGRPGLAYLGQSSNVDSYALWAAGRGKLATVLIECPKSDPGSCTLGVNGTSFSILLEGTQDEALAVSATTLRQSNLVAALARIRASGHADEHLDLVLLGLSGVLRQFTVLPEGFAGAGKRVLDAQIASMHSTLSGGQAATTIGYAALVENESHEDELHYGLLRACDLR